MSNFQFVSSSNTSNSHPERCIKISVVTVSYNQNHFLEKTIESVINQGYPNLDYIIMDGGSTDGSVDTIRRYEPYLSFWSSGPDGGPAAALNSGIGRCTGDIIGVVNSDDFYLPGTFQKVANTFQRDSTADVVYGNGYLVNAKDEIIRKIYSDRWGLTRYAYGAVCLMQPGSFFRKSIFERTSGFNEANRTCWDGELWVELALAGGRFVHIPEFLAGFRLHPDSIGGSQRLKSVYHKDSHALFRRIVGRDMSFLDRAVRGPLWRLRKHSELMMRRLSVIG